MVHKLKMQMGAGGVTCLTGMTQQLSHFQLLPLLYGQTVQMGVQAGETIGMAEYAIIAVSLVRSCKAHLSVCKSQYRLAFVDSQIDPVVEKVFSLNRMLSVAEMSADVLSAEACSGKTIFLPAESVWL